LVIAPHNICEADPEHDTDSSPPADVKTTGLDQLLLAELYVNADVPVRATHVVGLSPTQDTETNAETPETC
jgi:hypothetical protein